MFECFAKLFINSAAIITRISNSINETFPNGIVYKCFVGCIVAT